MNNKRRAHVTVLYRNKSLYHVEAFGQEWSDIQYVDLDTCGVDVYPMAKES